MAVIARVRALESPPRAARYHAGSNSSKGSSRTPALSLAAVEDSSRRHPVRRPVDQAADGPLGADGLRDQLLAQSVLERDDRPAGRQSRGDAPQRVGRVVTLDREEDELE